MERRRFLQILATTSAGLAAGCNTQKAEKLLPYVTQPTEFTPGTAVYYATTCLDDPEGAGMLARTREARAVKLEGNPQHPLTQGALSARGQAALQGLYNPDRLTRPMARGEDGTLHSIEWSDAINRLAALLGGDHAWLTGNTSTSDEDLITLFEGDDGRTPLNLRIYSEQPMAEAARAVFGYEGMPEFWFENADLLVSIGADFLETWGSPVSQIIGYTKMHAYEEGNKGRAIYVGPRRSNTAASCDKWIRLRPGLETAALRVIAEVVMQGTGEEAVNARLLFNSLPLRQAEELVGEAADSLRETGQKILAAEAPLVIASGTGEDAELAHMFALTITYLAGGNGSTLSLPANPREPRGSRLDAVRSLLNEFAGGRLDTLVVHEANPAFQLAGAAEQLDAAGTLVYIGTQMDETAARADLILPTHHYLESWGDHHCAAGVVGLLQPVMKPLHPTRSLAEIIIAVSRKNGGSLEYTSDREYMESRIQSLMATLGVTAPVNAAREMKKRGGIWQARQPVAGTLSISTDRFTPTIPATTDIVAHFYPHPYLYDGSGADKSWLQEVPETATSSAWNTWVEIHPDTARALGASDGDALTLKAGGDSCTAAVLPMARISPMVMPGVVAMPIGQGHEELGRYARGRGANPLKLCGLTAGGSSLAVSGIGVEVEVVKGAGRKLVTMAGSQDQGEREIAQAIKVPKSEDDHHDDHHHHIDPNLTMYDDVDYELYDWGMTVDLDKCVGCGACAVACYAENNLGVVGEQSCHEGREMSWIRIEKYVDEEHDDVRMIPAMCQQCHKAPCEPVCPVQAAYHSDEGLNAQVYNRCVGTRYCSNNCPYKQRRFNWFDYEYPAPLHLQLNPDVTVRERGVMEKCTFCVQRIKVAKEEAKNQGTVVKEGDTFYDGFELQPACAQTCPADVFTFGNLKDENSTVSKQLQDKRAYRLLELLGTKPSVNYLKKAIRKDV